MNRLHDCLVPDGRVFREADFSQVSKLREYLLRDVREDEAPEPEISFFLSMLEITISFAFGRKRPLPSTAIWPYPSKSRSRWNGRMSGVFWRLMNPSRPQGSFQFWPSGIWKRFRSWCRACAACFAESAAWFRSRAFSSWMRAASRGIRGSRAVQRLKRQEESSS